MLPFESKIVAVTLTVLVGIWLDRRPTRMALGVGIAVTLGFWIYLLTYHSQFTPSSANRITTNPTLFVAWVIAIATLAHWFRTVRPASSRGAIECVVVIGFGVLALNAIRPMFSETAFDRDRVDVRP